MSDQQLHDASHAVHKAKLGERGPACMAETSYTMTGKASEVTCEGCLRKLIERRNRVIHNFDPHGKTYALISDVYIRRRLRGNNCLDFDGVADLLDIDVIYAELVVRALVDAGLYRPLTDEDGLNLAGYYTPTTEGIAFLNPAKLEPWRPNEDIASKDGVV